MPRKTLILSRRNLVIPKKISRQDWSATLGADSHPSSQAWLRTVGYTDHCAALPRRVILDTLRLLHVKLNCYEAYIRLSVLEKAGVVKTPDKDFNADDFVNARVARMT